MKVKCIDNIAVVWGGLTLGDVYQVRGQGTDNRLRIENDAGDVRYYPAEWFELV